MTASQLHDQNVLPLSGRPLERDCVPGGTPMRDAWIPVAHSAHVTAKPTWRPLYSIRYFLWREQGRVRASEFHPAVPPGERPLASEFTGGTGYYPVMARYGMVWVWYGRSEEHTSELQSLMRISS